MSTSSHGPQKPLSPQEVYAWLYAMQCKRLELRMEAMEHNNSLARPQAFEGMSDLLDEAMEEVRVLRRKN